MTAGFPVAELIIEPAFAAISFGDDATLADMDGDGLDDLVIVGSDASDGTISVAYGSANMLSIPWIQVDVEIRMTGHHILDIENVGDLNGDGRDDLAVTADGDDQFAVGLQVVYIVYGGASWSQDAELGGVASALISAPMPDDGFGVLSRTGDLNSDGVDDLVVGAPNAGSNQEGSIYVFFGGRI